MASSDLDQALQTASRQLLRLGSTFLDLLCERDDLVDVLAPKTRAPLQRPAPLLPLRVTFGARALVEPPADLAERLDATQQRLRDTQAKLTRTAEHVRALEMERARRDRREDAAESEPTPRKGTPRPRPPDPPPQGLPF